MSKTKKSSTKTRNKTVPARKIPSGYKLFLIFFLASLGIFLTAFQIIYSKHFDYRIKIVRKSNFTLQNTYINVDRNLQKVCQKEEDIVSSIIMGMKWLKKHPQIAKCFPMAKWQTIIEQFNEKPGKSRLN